MPAAEKPAFFATTRWSVVLSARDSNGQEAAAALETLCTIYWRSLYGYARRQGCTPHDAEDMTQAFFARLLEKDYLQAVRRELGPFRAFLQMTFKRFLSKERERASALQRGGNSTHISIDFSGAEKAYTEESPSLPAEELFELRWALTVLSRVMKALREEFRAAGKEMEFDILKAALSAPKDGVNYETMARSIHSTEGAVRVAVHRLRKRFRELFRLEVAQTVAAHDDVAEEVRHLVSVLART